VLVVVQADAQGFEEADVVGGEGDFGRAIGKKRHGGFGLGFNFIQADGGFKHEEDVEALLANVFDDAGDLLRLGDRLVNCLPKLLG
jgi:hypothetical protein